jgi:Uma2 family endonuclease
MTTETDAGRVPMVERADWVPGPAQGRWTYADYARLPDDGHRYEIIDGVLYMPPAPNILHQRTVGRVHHHLLAVVELAGRGIVVPAPADVLLPGGQTVQPDVLVVLRANRSILTERNVEGAPDLVVEVSSPGTAGYDRTTKQAAYAGGGVPEYWIVDPYAETVEVLVLTDGVYASAGVYREQATLPSRVLPDLPLRVEQFFP